MSKPSDTDTNWSLIVALGAALGASACCTVPLALVSAGIGGAWISSLAALAPYRWVFVTLASGALAYMGYNEWRLSQRPDCDCETIFPSWARRLVLGAGALAAITLVVSPWLLGVSPSVATQHTQAEVVDSRQDTSEKPTTPSSYRQVVLTVDGMTCPACSITVRKALQDVDGVYKVEATYRPPEAIVRFDPKTASVDDLTRATKSAGFASSPKSSS